MDEPSPSPRAESPGARPLPEQVGRFRIVRRLGHGGMGSVYLAEDSALGRKVALKVAHLDASDPEEVVERFKREARAAASLDHPYLCPVHDVGTTPEGVYYIIMAFIEGKSLAQVIDKEGGLPPRQVAALVGKLAVALQEAHQKGVYHRDLKPSNVMIKSTGRGKEPVIVDFGLARRRDGADRLTKTGQVFGTPHYMAPEQIRGTGDQDGGSSDIFALGVILYELLTGRLPFDGPTHLAIIAQILTQPPPPPSAHRPGLDPRLEAICLKAMARDPSDRYPTMGELATALTDFLRGGAAGPPDFSNSAPADAPGPARRAGSDTLMAQLFERVEAESVAPTLREPIERPPPAPAEAPTRKFGRREAILAAGVAGVLGVAAAGYWIASGDSRGGRGGSDAPPVEPEASWTPLFNGKDLSGLETTHRDPRGLAGRTEADLPTIHCEVVDGVLVVRGGPPRGNLASMLQLSPRSLDLGDFHLRGEAMLEPGGSASLLFRNEVRPVPPRGSVWMGYAIALTGRGNSGSLHEFVNLRPDRLLARASEERVRPGQWFTLDLVAQEDRIRVSIDGGQVLDFRDPARTFSNSGRITLRLDEAGTVRFRKLEVRPLGEGE